MFFFPSHGFVALPKNLPALSLSVYSSSVGDCDSWSPFSSGCRPSRDGKSVDINGKKITTKALGDVLLMNIDGEFLSLEKIKKPKSIVIFLRHLG